MAENLPMLSSMRHARTLLGPGLLITLMTMAGMTAKAWDGTWTNAVTGEDVIYDDQNSQGKSGVPEAPQTFFIPPVPDFADIDIEELSDYGKKEYSPHALARINYELRYDDIRIPKGYYLIKPGDPTDGSERVHLNSPTARTLQGSPAPESGTAPVYRTFVIKRLGKVVAVLPIHRMEVYNPRKHKQKVPKHALAWVEIEERHPVLKFYHHKRIYSTDFQ